MSEGIEIEVYRHNTPKVYEDTLQGRREPSILDELTGNGGGKITISVNDPKLLEDPTLIDYRNVLKTKVDGKIIGAIIITHKKTITIAEGEKSEEFYEITGETLKTWFDDADVKPYGGLKVDSNETRSFSFASERGEWYDPSKWIDPVILAPVGSGQWGNWPIDWPTNSNAKWIWGEAMGASNNAPDNSICLFRYEFTVATSGNYVFYLAGDNYLDAYIDGQQVVTTDAKASAFLEPTRLEIYFPAGDHVMAMKVQNGVQATGNPAAALASLYRMNNGVEVLVGSSGGSGWKVLKYPTVMPGWTPGEIMVTLLNEAKARGVLFPNHLTPTFTTTHDSNNVPWGGALDWTFDIGESLASVVSKFEELGCYVWIDPDKLWLNMSFSRGVDRSVFGYGVDGITVTSTPIIFEQGKNLTLAESEGTGKIKNSLTIKTEVGWLVEDNKDVPSTTKYGVLESQLDTGASEAISRSLASVIFEQKAKAEEGATYEIIIRPEDDAVPFVNFFVGDWVMAPDDRRELVKRRVMSISVSESETGKVHYAIEFDTIFQDREARLNKIMSGGGVGGSYSNAGGSGTFTNSPIIIGGTGPAPIRLPKSPSGLVATSVGQWDVNGMTTFSEVTLTWNPVTANTDDTPTIPMLYEVWARLASGTDDGWMMHGITTTNTAILQLSPAPSDWLFKVRAANTNDAYSSFSPDYAHTAKGPTTAMPAPKPPILTSDKGVLIVGTSGLLVGDIVPPPQFRYFYATVATSLTGIYNRMGGTIQRDGRSISIPGLTVGSKYWVKLVGVDGANIPSAPSDATEHTLTGIDLGSLDADVAAAIQAGEDAGADATSALEIATAANNIVNGWKTPGQTTIDGGKITTDSVTSAQIAAYAITAQKIAIADFSNLATLNEVFGTTVTSYGQTKIVNGWNELVVDSGPFFMFKDQNGPLPFKAGDELFFEFSIKATTAYTTQVAVWLYNVGNTQVNSPTFAVTTEETIVTTSIKIPETIPVDISTWVMGLTGVANKGTKVRKVTVRRMHQGELIVDGAITSTKIGAGEVTAGKLAAQSVVSENLQAGSVVAGKIAAGAVTAKEIAAATITGNELKVGAIEARHIAAGVGGQLDITANASVNLLVGQVADAQADADATQANLAQMQTYYNFGAAGAVIGKPGSPFTLALRNDRIEMLENGNVVSYWNSGQMYVASFVGEKVILGNHQLEKSGSSTVVRTL